MRRRWLACGTAAAALVAPGIALPVVELPWGYGDLAAFAVVDVATGKTTVVGAGAQTGFEFLGWTSDSRRITYSVMTGAQRGIWTASPTGASRHRVSPAPADAGAWSPDGRWLAVARRGHLSFLHASSARAVRTSTPVEGDAVGPWAPDGKSLLVGGGLVSFPIGLLTGPLVKDVYEPGVWSPDSARVAFARSPLPIISVTSPGITVIDGPDNAVVGWPRQDAFFTAASGDTATVVTRWNLANSEKAAVGRVGGPHTPSGWWVSPDASTVRAAAEGANDVVHTWSLPGGQGKAIGRCLGPAYLRLAVFSPDGTKVVLGCHDSGE